MDQDIEQLKQWTPARIGVSRIGTRPLTAAMLELRLDHASAVDSVYGKVDDGLLKEMGWLRVRTLASSKEMYLKRPELGRKFDPDTEAQLAVSCASAPQVQIIVSDGLSAASVNANIRDLYPALLDSLSMRGISWGTTFFVEGGRVGCMDAIGEVLKPECAVLLIGERPGLVTAESMSAYMCYRPRIGRTDADRIVLSNIHRRGTPPPEAGAQIGELVERMLTEKSSGVTAGS